MILLIRARLIKVAAVADRLLVVVIVHKENKVADPTLKELRALLLLDRQFWPDGSRVVLIRRPTTSAEEKTLLRELYSMTEDKLRKYWTGRLFRGEIPALPSIVRAGPAAVAAVSKDRQAISVVLSTDVEDGVRTLSIDGKRPEDKGYPLAVKEAK